MLEKNMKFTNKYIENILTIYFTEINAMAGIKIYMSWNKATRENICNSISGL